MLGCLATLIMIAAAIASGAGYFSFWWVTLPVFLAGSLALSNGPHYARVIQANERGQVSFFPLMLASYCATQLAVAGLAYWAGTLLR